MDRFNSLAAQLAGLNLDSPDSPAPQKPAKAKLTAPPDLDEDDDDDDDLDTAARDQDTTSDEIDPDADPASDAFDPDAPVLSDDDAEDADGEAEDDPDSDDAANPDTQLKKDNFKLREAKRQLKADLEAAQQRLDELEAKLAAVPNAASTPPSFGGYFSQVTKAEDLPAVEARLQADIDFLEDNAEGYSYTDQNTGQEVEVTKAQARELKRNLQSQLRYAPKVLEMLTQHQTRAQEADTLARKKYPFVFDPKAKLNERVLDAAKEFPELSRSPVRALALGRLAIGKLVESGEYTLVKRTKTAPASARPAASAKAAPSSAPPPIPGRNGSRHSAPKENLGERIARGDRDALEDAAMALITPSK